MGADRWVLGRFKEEEEDEEEHSRTLKVSTPLYNPVTTTDKDACAEVYSVHSPWSSNPMSVSSSPVEMTDSVTESIYVNDTHAHRWDV